MSVSRGFALTLLAVVAAAAPAGLLAWQRLALEDRLSQLEPKPVPVIISVEERAVSDVTPVIVEPQWGPAPVLLAPSWSGTLVDVRAMSGTTVSSGDVLVRVDGVDRVAVTSSAPFWRRLGPGDHGDDVATLQHWLASTGLYDGEGDGVYGRATSAAVDAWARTLGVSDPNGVFDPGWVVWLPMPAFEVAVVNVSPGGPAPPPGSVIVSGPVPLLSVTVADDDGREVGTQGRWLLSVYDVEVAMVDGRVDRDGISALSSVLDAQVPSSAGQIRRAAPAKVIDLPATAIVSNADGELCVFVPEGERFIARGVTVASGGGLRVAVATGLSPGVEVLVNPADVLPRPACP